MKLSTLDKRVLKEVLFNGFVSFSELASRLRLSQGTLLYSLRKLRQLKAIQGYRIRINPLAVGYKYVVLFLIEPKEARHTDFLRDELAKYPWISAVSVITGRVDIVAFAYFCSYQHMGEAISEILSAHGDKIFHISTIPVVSVNKLHQKGVVRHIPLNLDEWDKEILNLLYVDPNRTIKSISEELGKSRNFVAARIRRLYTEQVILKKSAKIDLSFLQDIGISCWAMVFFDARPEARAQLVRELVRLDPVHELFALGTTHDFLAVVRATNISELHRFIRYLVDRDLVIKTDTNVVLSFREHDIGTKLFSHSPCDIHEISRG